MSTSQTKESGPRRDLWTGLLLSAERRDHDATWDIVDQNGDHVASVPNPYEHLGDRDDLVAEAAPQTEALAHLVAASSVLAAALAAALPTLDALAIEASDNIGACIQEGGQPTEAEWAASRQAGKLADDARAALAKARGQ